MRRQHDRLARDLNDRHEILQRIVVDLVDVRRCSTIASGTTRIVYPSGAALAAASDAEVAVGAGPVLDHDLLAERARQVLRRPAAPRRRSSRRPRTARSSGSDGSAIAGRLRLAVGNAAASAASAARMRMHHRCCSPLRARERRRHDQTRSGNVADVEQALRRPSSASSRRTRSCPSRTTRWPTSLTRRRRRAPCGATPAPARAARSAAAGRPARPPPRHGSSPASRQSRMPTCAHHVLGRDELGRGARQRCDLRNQPGLRQRHRPAVDQIEPLERQRLRSAARGPALRQCPPAARAARSAAAARWRRRPARTASRAGHAAA